MKIGIFEATENEPCRWMVFNTVTEVSHITYGTSEEVIIQLRQADEAWQRRMLKPGFGNYSWRSRQTGEIDQVKQMKST